MSYSRERGVLVRKAPKKLKVRRPSAQYQDLAEMLREQYRSMSPIGASYVSLAVAIEVVNENPFGFKFALGSLLREIATRVGKLQEMESRLHGAPLHDEETARWLIDFLVQHESRGRYNKSLIDACRIAGEALRVHANLPKVVWTYRYNFAAPPDMGRRIQVSA